MKFTVKFVKLLNKTQEINGKICDIKTVYRSFKELDLHNYELVL